LTRWTKALAIMGIPGLIAFLRKRAPAAFKRATVDDLRGKTIGIDLSITLYRGASTAYKNGVFSHMETLAREVGWLLELGCKPVYVMDGETPKEKAEEAKKREESRNAAEKRLGTVLAQIEKSPGDVDLLETLQKLQRQCFRVTFQMRSDSRSLLEAMGISIVVAPGEAERCLAHMMRSGAVDMAFTEDIDVLVCGSPLYMKNSASLMYEMQSATSMEGGRFAELVSLKEVLECLEVSYEGFVTMSVLSGCDFAPKLPRFGPATAWKHVRKFSEDMDACFDNLKSEDQVWRDRYKKSLLRSDDAEVWPEAETTEPSRERLEELFARLGKEASSLSVLRCYVDRCSDTKTLEEERAMKRSRCE
jgi:5'-3' exonuclease